jgi:hypothetical protein
MDTITFPEINATEIILTLSEETVMDGDWENHFMVISFGDVMVYRTQVVFEYFEEFLEIGEQMKAFYGNKLTDVKLEVNGYLLYGDSVRAFFYVEQFIRTVKGNRAD